MVICSHGIDVGSWRYQLRPTGIAAWVVWLAWPSLQKPAEWLPSGITAIVLVCMGACAVQPRLLLVLVPLVGTLIGIGAAVRFLRKI